jgi:hypothetical protein
MPLRIGFNILVVFRLTDWICSLSAGVLFINIRVARAMVACVTLHNSSKLQVNMQH